MTFLLGETAADNNHPLGLKAIDSSLTHIANPSLSVLGPLLHSTWKIHNHLNNEKHLITISFNTQYVRVSLFSLPANKLDIPNQDLGHQSHIFQ